MKVLLIEDGDFLAASYKEVLEGQGHEVQWVTGIKRFDPLQGQNGQGDALDVSAFDIALVDGQVDGEFQGPAIVAELSKQGHICIGISTQRSINDEMLESGAILAYGKLAVLAALFNKSLKLEDASAPSEEMRENLAFLEANLLKQTELKNALEKLVKSHM